ncbi:hypothetical protein CI109_101105 [Kwoniella shandongensis]|uniref:Uncharacterized protein n=1 Tax=Kwoniella shandongensis TaxID=1734106 RepID=A0A5M6CAQ9_9TREE|nr:uncharacterized protein CI109_001575 [Kwoniella shandongensis]KAA5530169.1 hypothetical protein CI109_001575 [Kwoniella shandongensis]
MSQNHVPNGHSRPPTAPVHSHSHSSSRSHSHSHHHDLPSHGGSTHEVEDAAARRLAKGKQRAADATHIDADAPIHRTIGTGTPDGRLTAMLDEAIHDQISPPSISSSLESSSFLGSSPISHPAEAHHHIPMRPPAPRLLSGLTRTTLPISSLNYASADAPRRSHDRAVSRTDGTERGAESSTAWQRAAPTTALSDAPFPDLDPTTGLPLDLSPSRRDSTSSNAPSLHLQRTITGLLAAPPATATSTSGVGAALGSSILPSMPNINFSMPRVSLPSKPSLEFGRRALSSTPSQADLTSWASGWWGGNKGKVDDMMTEEDRADTVEEEKEKLRRKYRSPRNPIVFCHGLLGFDVLGPSSLPTLQISHWRGIREVLESNGVEVLIARVPATSSIKDRAIILEEFITEKFPGREVNLVGHSMGGLDCRYLISELQPKGFHPISLTTISTPHRGSPFADYVIDNWIGRDRLTSMVGLIEMLGLPQSGDGTAFNALRTQAMKEFNAEVLDREDVKYYSWGATIDPGLLDTFKWPHSVILAKEGPNDGLVSVHSAMWGEYRGTLVGVNHLDLVGWVNSVRYTIGKWAGKPVPFKPATFYLEVADYLAEQGF